MTIWSKLIRNGHQLICRHLQTCEPSATIGTSNSDGIRSQVPLSAVTSSTARSTTRVSNRLAFSFLEQSVTRIFSERPGNGTIQSGRLGSAVPAVSAFPSSQRCHTRVQRRRAPHYVARSLLSLLLGRGGCNLRNGT